MIFHQNTRLPAGKMVGAIVLAAVLGMLLPLITLAQITLLLPVLMLGGLFAVYLQCYGGPAPACTFLAVGLISAGWLTGSTLMWMLLAASLLFSLGGMLVKLVPWHPMAISAARSVRYVPISHIIHTTDALRRRANFRLFFDG